jgi:hypothetical protein
MESENNAIKVATIEIFMGLSFVGTSSLRNEKIVKCWWRPEAIRTLATIAPIRSVARPDVLSVGLWVSAAHSARPRRRLDRAIDVVVCAARRDRVAS